MFTDGTRQPTGGNRNNNVGGFGPTYGGASNGGGGGGGGLRHRTERPNRMGRVGGGGSNSVPVSG